MTIEIQKIPNLLQPHIQTVFSNYGLIIQQNPLRIVCSSFKNFRQLKLSLIELNIQFVEMLSPSVILQNKQLTTNVKQFVSLASAKLSNNPIQITITEKQFQTELLYFLHYILHNQQNYSVLIIQIPPEALNQLTEQLMCIDQIYHLQKQIFIGLIDKSEYSKKMKIVNSYKHEITISELESDFKIEIQQGLICDNQSMKLLRNKYVFQSMNILEDRKYQIFMENQSELNQAEFELRHVQLICDSDQDREKIKQFQPMNVKFVGNLAKIQFKSLAEAEAVRKFWTVEGKEVKG